MGRYGGRRPPRTSSGGLIETTRIAYPSRFISEIETIPVVCVIWTLYSTI
jgi:hypothetical protein